MSWPAKPRGDEGFYTFTTVEPFLYFGEAKIAIYRDRTRICTWGGPKLKNKKKKNYANKNKHLFHIQQNTIYKISIF